MLNRALVLNIGEGAGFMRHFVKASIISTALILKSAAICYSSPLEIEDARGKVLTLSHPPQRIISLSPAITETLFALGLDRQIVGVTNLCDYPAKAKKKMEVGSYLRPNLEKIIALQPDLVLSTTHTSLATERLEKLGVPVFVINPKTLQASMDSILSVGEVTGKAKEAAEIVARLNQRIESVTDRLRYLKEEGRPSVFWQIGSNPLVTVGPGTLGHDLIVLAGGRNIVGNALTEYPRYSLEAILYKNPEVIIIVGMVEGDYSVGEIQRWNKWKDLSAVKNKRVYRIDSNLVTRRGSPRVVDGLEEVVHILHPELFNQQEPNKPK
jgi:iron complex transport system substrate-binding protein